jgi:hypothetical protein
MEYNKLTKAELIELLEQSISLEKYNRLEESLKTKKKALEEQEVVIHTLKQQIEFEKATSQNHIKELKENTNDYVEQVKSQFQDMKSHIDYTSNALNKEYQLANLLVENRSKDNQFIDELIKLYHEAVFENKEEENTQESEQ